MTAYKTAIALAKHYVDRPSLQMNAIGHLAFALGAEVSGSDRARYFTGDGLEVGNLSWWPLVILSGSAAKIEALWQDAMCAKWARACFLETMIHGGSDAQLTATRNLCSTSLPIIAVAIHAPTSQLDPYTRKLSLWRGQ